jgi:hypothetical protein
MNRLDNLHPNLPHQTNGIETMTTTRFDFIVKY